MVIMKLSYAKMGGHYHCRLFTRLDVGDIWEECGELVFREAEWGEVRTSFMRGGFAVLSEAEL